MASSSPSRSPSPPPPMDTTTLTATSSPPSPLPPSTAIVPAPTRRLPPPCWSPEETVALIDAYRDKWYSLRRGNLKAQHWQEVAEAVAERCPDATPAKTAVQCRHKMEKLRKRYRTELQRARSIPVSRFRSSWVHFGRMDEMEKGVKVENSDSGDDEEYGREGLFGGVRNGNVNMRSVNKLYGNGAGVGVGPVGVGSVGNSFSGGNLSGGGSGSGSGSGSGFRIRIPTGVSVAQPGVRSYGRMDNQSDQSRFSSPIPYGKVIPESNMRHVLGKREREEEKERVKEKAKDPLEEMVGAIKMLGDGFVRMEKMKMEMAREMESMRMQMEMKRTEMILQSQQRIVETFANAVAENRAKKMKRIPSPEA